MAGLEPAIHSGSAHKGHRRRVALVEGAIQQRGLEVHARIARHHARTRRAPDTVRAVDVAFISRIRQPKRPTTFLTAAPELVVEIVSPSDRWDGIRQKLAEYFAAGVERVWIVEPGPRTVLVFRAVTAFSELGEGDTLRGEGVLSGFELPLAELFAE